MDLLTQLFARPTPLSREILDREDSVWSVLANLDETVARLLGGRRIIKGTIMPGAFVADGPMYVGAGAIVEPGAAIMSPAFIGDGVSVRGGAYVRENCVLLERSVLGHASEVKHSLFMPGAKAPHFAYVGDSILGCDTNLGAGTKLSNVKVTRIKGRAIRVAVPGATQETGLEKLGSIIGDRVQIGCNAVLNPGTVVGPDSIIYAGSVVSGYIAAGTIVKSRQAHEYSQRLPTTEG